MAARLHASIWYRLPPALIGLFAVMVIGLLATALIVGPLVRVQIDSLATSTVGITLLAVQLMLPMVLVTAGVGLAWAGGTAYLADGALATRPTSLRRALAAATRRLPASVRVALAWFLAPAAALAVTPLLVLAGVGGLAVTPLARRSSRMSNWPARATLVALAIPLVLPFLLAVRWSLALPAVWLDDLSARRALRRSWDDVTGRTGRVFVALLASVTVVVAVATGLDAIGSIFVADTNQVGFAVSQVLVSLLAGPLPIVTMVVLYRRGAPGPLASTVDLTPVPWSSSPATAVVTAFALVASLLAAAAADPPVAEAAGAETTFIDITTSPASPFPSGTATVGVTVRRSFAEPPQPTGDFRLFVDDVEVAGSPFTVPPCCGAPPVDVSVPFTAGAHRIRVEYPGDSNFAPASETLDVLVGDATSTSLTVSESSSTFGDPLTFTAKVTGPGASPTGLVRFSGPGTSDAEVALTGGVATLVTSAVPTSVFSAGGAHEITASYLGDATHLGSTSPPVSVSVAQAATSTTLSLAPASPSPAGATITATIDVSSTANTAVPDGSASIVVGTTTVATGTLVGGRVELDFTMAPGTRFVGATYAPPGSLPNFLSSSTSELHTVSLYPAAVTLQASPTAAAFGQPVVLDASVNPGVGATGVVEFRATPVTGPVIVLGSAPLDASGDARLSVSSLAIGTYDISAHYAGDTTVAAGSSPTRAVTVSPAATATTVVSAPTSASFADVVLVSVSVATRPPGAGTPSGSVSLLDGTAVLASAPLNGSGAASLSFTASRVDVIPLVVSYSPDAQFEASQASFDLTVGGRATTTTLFGFTDRSSVYGEAQTFEGVVSSAGTALIPTGSVRLTTNAGTVATAPLDPTGAYSITTNLIPATAFPWAIRVVYLGDASFASSTSTAPVSLEVAKADAVPVLTVDNPSPTVGDTVTLRAELPTPGAGPTGTITFRTYAGVLGTAPMTGGVASLDVVIDATSTLVFAEYPGDRNFAAGRSTDLRITADRATPTITVAGPMDAVPFATTATVTATVSVAAAAGMPATVTFRRAGSTQVVASGVPVVRGVASIEVCGAAIGVSLCGPGTAELLIGTHDIVAEVGASSLRFGATSAPVSVEVVRPEARVALSSRPGPEVLHGSAVTLTATVSAVASPATPTGSVAFMALQPSPSGGFAELSLGTVPLAGGTASLQLIAGVALSWRTEFIKAYYLPNTIWLGTADATTPLSVKRFGVTMSGYSAGGVPGAATPVTAFLDHEPGTAAGFSAPVTFTADDGRTCIAPPPAGARNTNCSFVWDTAGPHWFTASYPGDDVFEPATLGRFTVTLRKAPSSLNAYSPGRVVQDAPTAVSWSMPGANATGTVTVRTIPSGVVWCSVDVSARSCSGSFGRADVFADPSASLYITYTGDSNFESTVEVVPVDVQGCHTIDVFQWTAPSSGSFTIDTPPNCGGGTGYLSGTRVLATATPTAPYEFRGWERLDRADGWVIVGTSLTGAFRVSDDFLSWSFAARFALPCYAVTGLTEEGRGFIDVVTPTNCVLRDGSSGWEWGTTITANPVGSDNPRYGEPDVFYEFGTLPPGAVVEVSPRGYFAQIEVLVDAPVTIPVTFGPRCRSVTMGFSPSDPGDVAVLSPDQNCVSPHGSGYTRTTDVTITPTKADPAMVVDGWDRNDRPDQTLGSAGTVTLRADTDVELTARFVACHTLDVRMDTAYFQGASQQFGTVEVDTPPNCPDGSTRYREGTVVVATPTPDPARKGARFVGWCDSGCDASDPIFRLGVRNAAAGVAASGVRTIVVDRDISIMAAFHWRGACSLLRVRASRGLVSFGDTGCGPGYYFDRHREWATAQGIQRPDYSEDGGARSIGTYLIPTFDPNVNLEVFSRVGRGAYLGRRDCWPADCDGPVAGDISVAFEACQVLRPDIRFTRHGDESGREYRLNEFGGFGSWNWLEGSPESNGCLSGIPESVRAWIPNTEVALRTWAPALGFQFESWGPVDNQIGFEVFTDGSADSGSAQLHPLGALIRTDDSDRFVRARLNYTAYCGNVNLGTGITLLEPSGSNCPGGGFVFGSFLKIRAEQNINGRIFDGFSGSVVNGTETADEFGRVEALVLVNSKNVSVSGKYPSSEDRFWNGMATAGKIFVGVAAVALPVLASMACPPCGLALGALTLGAFLGDMIPGTNGSMSAALDLVNPFSVLECAARWGFGKESGNVAGLSTPGAVAKTVSTSKQGVKILASGWDAFAHPKTVSTFAKAGAAAAIVAGSINAGILETDLSYQTVDQLRSTAAWNSCLDEQYRAVT